MALTDDLRRLADEETVYLSRGLMGAFPPAFETFKGRLRQAVSGEWVFTTFAGQNGVMGIDLGNPDATAWTTTDSPSFGLTLTITKTILSGIPALSERTLVSTQMPAAFAE